MSIRKQKVANLIKELAASFFATRNNKVSLLTITDCAISSDFRKATVFISVMPESMEKIALAFVKRQRGEFRTFLKDRLKIKVIPIIDVNIDKGEKHRQRIEVLLRQ